MQADTDDICHDALAAGHEHLSTLFTHWQSFRPAGDGRKYTCKCTTVANLFKSPVSIIMMAGGAVADKNGQEH